MNTQYFGNLDDKLKTGVSLAKQHNAYADMMYNTKLVVLQRYDLLEVQAKILKAHRKFYGMTSKYPKVV